MKLVLKNPANLLIMSIMVLTMALTFSCSSGDDDDSGGSVTYEGKTYNTVRIGTQTWMAENMNHAVGISKCYGNDPANCATYGRLYDWATAKTVCPSGWHLPSKDEWDILMEYVETDNGSTYTPGIASIAGKYLKATSGWNKGGNGEDKYGFAALPGGIGYSDGSFINAGYNGRWWSATEYDSSSAYNRRMDSNSGYAEWYDSDKSLLFSVRCLQDVRQ